jgi:Do/DeqQ family serine protease
MKNNTLKRFGLLVLAAILGSTLTIITLKTVEPKNTPSFKIEHNSPTPVIGAAYTVNKNGEVVPLEFTAIAKKAMPAVVHIKSTQLHNPNSGYQRNNTDPFREFFEDDLLKRFFGPDYRNESPRRNQGQPYARIGSGSGVIISTDGYIVTNNHVIANADDIEVSLEDNRVFKAKIIGTDPSTDLALIQIKAQNLPFISFTNSDEVEVGEWVLAVGNPFNLNSTVTAGIVSAKGRNINILQDRSAIESFIQTDAAINPGNSGGALVDLNGGLIGINTAIASPTGTYAGYGFAVPSNIVSKVVRDLQEYGMVQRGYLGVLIRDVDGNLAKEKNLDITEGVYIDSIPENSAAGEMGIKPNDVIISVDEVSVKSSAELLEAIGSHHPGDKVNIKVNRFGKEKVFTVTLRNLNGKEHIQKSSDDNILIKLGIELEEIDRKTARKIGRDGLRITKITNGIIKRHTQIRVGLIITKVDGEEIESIEEFKNHYRDKKGGSMIEGVYEDYPGIYYYAFGL